MLLCDDLNSLEALTILTFSSVAGITVKFGVFLSYERFRAMLVRR